MRVAEAITLSPEEEGTLSTWARGRSLPSRLCQRARVIQMAAAGHLSQDIARSLRISRPTVQLWRERFLALRLAGLEKDAPRPGRIPRIPSAKLRAIVEATLHTTPPQATHWSTRTMAKAQGVSEATVRRIWKQHRLQPHRLENFKLSRDKDFLEKIQDVVGLYLNPPDKALVLCVDEKSQIQALDRTRPLLPLRPGIPARHPRFHFHFIPTSSSWLNMVERWFREITDKRIRRGTFQNVPVLVKAIMDYIENHNQNPKVFVWTAPVDRSIEKSSKSKEALDALH